MHLVKKGFPFILALFLGFGSAEAQQNLTAAQWRSDLSYFKDLIHKKYPNLFYRVTAGQFDSAVAALDKKAGSLTDLQMRVEITRIVASFHIGHTAVRKRAGADNPIPWVHMIPVKFNLFNDGLYIQAIDGRYKEAVGGKVTGIGTRNTEQALQMIRPVISFENEQGFKNMLQYYLNVPEFLQATGIIDHADRVPVTYLKDGIEKTITLAAEELPAPPSQSSISNPTGWVDAYEDLGKPTSALWLKEPNRLRYFEYLPDSKTVYVRHSEVHDESNETIKDFFDKVFRFVDSNEVDRFVLDIRLNGGGNNYLNKAVITGIIQAKKINRNGHLFVILGKATFSAAQNLTNELEKYTEGIFVGEPTAENVNFYGDTRTEILPNSNLTMALSWLWWQNLDPRDKRQWTAPQLAVDMNFTDYRNGVDPSMNAILNFKGGISVEEQLRDLILKGNYEEALAVAKNYLNDPLHRYYREELESKINDYGYSLLSAGKPQVAKKVLYLNVALFPGSANANDSYAEACWKSGDTEEAIKYYNISIQMDPNGETGENSRKMLEQIKGKH